MQNRERHPVDELFAKRLGEVEKSPSPRAWDELQGRLTKKKDSRKGIIWAIAASVTVLMGCFGLWLYEQPNAQIASVPNKSREISVSKQPMQTQPTTQKPTMPLAQLQPSEETTESQLLPKEAGKAKKPHAKTQFTNTIESNASIAQQTPKAVIAIQEDPMPVAVRQETIALTTPSVDKAPTSEITVVVVEIPEAVVARSQTEVSDTSQPIVRKAEKLWNAIKKAKKSEINLDKEAIVAWVKDRNTKN